MFDSILDSLKGEASGLLKDKVGLNDLDIDKAMSSSKDAFEKTVSDESGSNGMGNLLNLFSKDDNSNASDGVLKSLGGNLISSLSSNGFSSDKASSIKDTILPIIMNLFSDKVGGDSNILSSLLKSGNISDMASGFVKEKGAGFLKGLFKKK